MRGTCDCDKHNSCWLDVEFPIHSVQAGSIADAEMFRTFNMGVGMVIVVDQADVEAVLHAGLGAFRIGDVVPGDGVSYV